MLHRHRILAGCVLAGLAAPSVAGAFPYPVHTKTLDNGCELVVIPMPSEGVVATAVWMDVGSRNEVEPGRTGFAHFFEHLLFSGTEAMSRPQRDRALLKLGIGDNAWTWLDETVYTGVSDVKSLEPFMGMQADMLAHLALTEDHVRREAGAVYGEYRKTVASPDFHLEQALRKAAFDVHPYGHDTLGYEADIAAMPDSYDYALTFYERWYRPDAATVLLVGDVEPEPAFAMLEGHFGPWEPSEPEVPEVPAEPPADGPERVAIGWDSEIPPHLMIGWRIPAHDPEDRELAALQLAESVLLGRAGRLTNRLIREEAVALDVGGGRDVTVDPGLFTIHVQLKSADDRERVEAIIDEEITRLVDGADPDFLARTRSHVRYSALTALDDPETVLYIAGSRLRRGADPEALDAFDELVGQVDAEGLSTAVSAHLREDNRTTVWLAHGANASEPTAPEPPEVPDAP